MNINIYKTLLKRIGIIFAIYSVTRIVFSMMNDDQFVGVSVTNYSLAFLHGFRFDFAAIIIINAIFILISILPFEFIQNKITQFGLKIFFFIINIPMIILNIIDIEYFKFTGKRTQSSILGISQDIKNQSIQLISYYWYFVIISIVLIIILWKYYPNNKNLQQGYMLKKWHSFLMIPFIIIFSVIGARGGLQLRPLSTNNAFVITPQILGHFTLNSPYVFISSFAVPGKLNQVNYFSNQIEVKSILSKGESNSNIKPNHDNVVIIILESFDSEYLGIGNQYKGYSPFFDSLAKNSLYFNHCFANGRTSIEALPSILASLPSLMQEPYITSYYQDNKITGIGSILKQHGYQTSFYHGGKNGTMNFDAFASIAGFDQYKGLNEYPNHKDFDGNWGIFDEPYLQYFAKEISQMKQPFATAVFTLSSHQPYTIPAQHKGKFPKGDLEIHECIGYSDYALKQFFEAASKTSWYKNTLFVLTADHTQMTSRPEYQNTKGMFTIPLVFFHPSKKLKADTSIITQQTDIMPSVLEALGINNKNQLLFGKSIFAKKPIAEAVNFTDNILRVYHKDMYIEFNKDNQEYSLHQFDNESVIDNKKKAEELLLKAKAYHQYFNNGLIKNEW